MPSLFKTIVAALAVTASPALANLSLLRSPVPYAQVANRAQSPGRMMGPAPASPRSKTWSSLSIMILVTASLMQSIATVNVATTSHLTFTVNPSIGPNGSGYFIRFRTPNAAHTAYSAKFTLKGMTGVNTLAPTTRATKALPSPTAATGGAFKNDAPGALAAGVAVVAGAMVKSKVSLDRHHALKSSLPSLVHSPGLEQLLAFARSFSQRRPQLLIDPACTLLLANAFSISLPLPPKLKVALLSGPSPFALPTS
ncbi:12810_t:CDS:2 [Acaulospora colombiana]|uniref:12810_t:CDS:1 n=1 Tax=Acaulospora colombiana TaxID=27376 RepID=A0ACA9PD09_9GLOM|nr:12810_t:CDS:2 [Acaulospora colombiana]